MAVISNSQLKNCKYYKDLGDKTLDALYVISRCYKKTAAACNLPQDCLINADNINLVYDSGRPSLVPNNPEIYNVVQQLETHDFESAPKILDLAKNFGNAMRAWRATGYATVSEEQYKFRDSICKSCPFWKVARFKLGRCMHPKCGCTSAKHHLAGQTCPLGKW